MQLENLDTELQPFQGREVFTKRDHRYRQFFLDRRITNGQVGNYLGIQQSWVSEAMRGIRILSDEKEALLGELKGKLDAWELREGRQWNSPPPETARPAPDFYKK